MNNHVLFLLMSYEQSCHLMDFTKERQVTKIPEVIHNEKVGDTGFEPIASTVGAVWAQS